MARRLVALLGLLSLACSAAAVRAGLSGDQPEGPRPQKLKENDIDELLAALPPDSYLLVELYAPWCPVCQRFRPHLERVAARFNGPPTEPVVRVGVIDCVGSAKLCVRFKVQGYPTLRFGHPADFMGAGLGEDVSGAPRDAEALLGWINRKLHQSWTLELPAAEAQAVPEALHAEAPSAYPAPFPPPPLAAGAPAGVDLGDIERATVLAFEYAVSGERLTAERRQDFVSWLALLAAAHPVSPCRAGAASLYDALAVAWPVGRDAPSALARFKPCGVDRAPPAVWGACAGTQADSRGYSCGLWALLHALAARVEARHGGSLWLVGARGFVGSFFACDDCSKHFMARTAAEDMQALGADGGASASATSLALWRVHNEVTARLAGEEAANGGPTDPAFPKLPWPPASLCPGCICADAAACFGRPTWPGAPGGLLWDETAVERFLMHFYAANSEGPWDPFGLGASAAPRLVGGGRGRILGLEPRLGHRTAGDSANEAAATLQAPRLVSTSGRARDAADEEATTLRLDAAPGGLSPLVFILLCAVTPVAVYALAVACGGPRKGKAGKGLLGGHDGRRPPLFLLARLLPRLWREKGVQRSVKVV